MSTCFSCIGGTGTCRIFSHYVDPSECLLMNTSVSFETAANIQTALFCVTLGIFTFAIYQCIHFLVLDRRVLSCTSGYLCVALCLFAEVGTLTNGRGIEMEFQPFLALVERSVGWIGVFSAAAAPLAYWTQNRKNKVLVGALIGSLAIIEFLFDVLFVVSERERLLVAAVLRCAVWASVLVATAVAFLVFGPRIYAKFLSFKDMSTQNTWDKSNMITIKTVIIATVLFSLTMIILAAMKIIFIVLIFLPGQSSSPFFIYFFVEHVVKIIYSAAVLYVFRRGPTTVESNTTSNEPKTNEIRDTIIH